MRKTIAYGRVSSQQQANVGALERQERALLDSTNADEVILDVGTGTSTARPGYQRVLELIGAGEVDRLLCADQDRLNRSVQADLELLQLCRDNGTRIFDLNGREMEFRTPDGELLVTVIGALNQHRSAHYGAKVRRSLQTAREMGKPVSPRAPFGLRKVRDPKTGRVVSYEVDPETAPLAMQRIRWFLDGHTLVQCINLMGRHHGHNASTQSLENWLKHPALAGRLAWKVDRKGNHQQVQDEPSFTGLISDAQRELILAKLATRTHQRALRDRQRRMFSGIFRCADCGNLLAYKFQSGARANRGPGYLRCNNRACRRSQKHIRLNTVFGVMQFALHQHAQVLAPLLDRPQVDPIQVGQLKAEIQILKAITGTEALVAQKEDQITRIRSQDSTTPAWILVGLLQAQTFWLSEEEVINDVLNMVVRRAEIALGETLDESLVSAVHFKTDPSEALLPASQTDVAIPVTLRQLAVTALQQERIDEAIASLRLGG